MVGSPPPSDRLIQFADGSHLRFPQLRRSVANFRRFVPSTNVWRGDGPVAVLPRALREDIDAIVVLHKGRIVYERYPGVMTSHTQHMSMSVTKSIFGTLGAMLVEEGALDERALVTKHVVR